jgi:hypothetical protein
MKKRINKKAQVWGIDLAVALIIFFGAILFFYKYGIEAIDSEKQDASALLQDAKLISNYLVSPGYPENWTLNDVTLLGLTDQDARLSPEKVQMFYNFSKYNYTQSRMLLSTSHHYFVFFESKEGNATKIYNVSWIGRNYTIDNPRNIIKISRFVFYNSSIIKMNVYVWQK